MYIRLLLISLTIVCVIMGLHYFKFRYGIGPGLPDLSTQFAWLQPTPTPIPDTEVLLATRSATPVETIPQQLGNLMAVPLLLDESGVASGSVTLDYIRETQPAIVVLFGSELPATAAASVTQQLRQLPRPPLIAVDHEGGSVQRLAGVGFTILPSWQQLCSMTAQKRSELIASSAAQLKTAGVDIILGPVLDLTASGSALSTRTCAADPEKVTLISQEIINRYKQAGLASMIKHYPGIGTARADLHTQSAKVTLTPEDTQPFESLLTSNPTLPVMISHVRIEPADPQTPCSLSSLCVGELHRVFPQAVLVSDALEMKSAGYLASSSAILRPLPERASSALAAGIEVLLFGPSVTQAQLQQVTDELVADFTSENQLDANILATIARVKQWRDTLRNGYNGN